MSPNSRKPAEIFALQINGEIGVVRANYDVVVSCCSATGIDNLEILSLCRSGMEPTNPP